MDGFDRGFVMGVVFSLVIGIIGFAMGKTAEQVVRLQLKKQEMQIELPPKPATPSAWTEAEMECLARTIYGEARNQPYHGQVAVGAVVVSRSLHPSWPSNLCDVVSPKRQFGGFYKGVVRDRAAWGRAQQAARHATVGYASLPESYRTAYFFRNETDGSFARFAKLKGKIGDHYFYGLKT